MKKWLLRILYACIALAPAAVWADYTATQGAGSTVFAFVCSSTKICPATVLIDSTNVEKATAGNPLRIDPTGTTTQPVSSATLSTAANQSSQITQETATAGALGTTTDAVGSTPSTASAATVVALLKAVNNNVAAAIPSGTNTIGNVGSDPSSGKGTPSSVAINVSTATTTQLVALSGSTKIYVTSFDVIAGGTGNITFEYGTGGTCATGATALTGAYNLTAQAGISKGSGVGAVLVVPAGNALCVLTSAAVQMSGSVSFQQF